MTALQAARRLAERICAAARWQGDRCTWTDPEGEPLEADVYAGTAGVAWFLAHLAAVTGDRPAARTAAGAVRSALDLVAGRHAARSGLLSGDLGTLWAAATVGGLLDDAGLAERARALLPAVQHRLPPAGRTGFELLGGTAGDLLAMVGLADRSGPAALHEAERTAKLLVEGADPMPYGVAWPLPPGTDPAAGAWTAAAKPPGAGPAYQVGMAHGASGVARALLELDAATGADRFRDAVGEALAFERAWFDRAACAWRNPVLGLPTSTSWCRGSAGIGLARLRWLELAPEPQPRLQAEAGAALASVHASVAGALSSGWPARAWEQLNFSVCHGLMGAADLLVYASRVLGVAEHHRAAERVAEHGLATAAAEGRWPCGTLDRSEAVGLLLGLAGIGAVLLRVAVPERVPPVGLLAYSTS